MQIIRAKVNPDYVPPFTTIPGAVKSSFKENGFRGPFQGLLPTLMRNTPANALYLGNFEVMKRSAGAGVVG